MRKLTFARGWKGHGGTVCTQAVGLLPAWVTQREAYCPLSCSVTKPAADISLLTELAGSGVRYGCTGLMGMEWGPQPGWGSHWNWSQRVS